jgi:hypothetical protein
MCICKRSLKPNKREKDDDRIRRVLEELFTDYTLNETNGHEHSKEIGLLRILARKLKIKTYYTEK